MQFVALKNPYEAGTFELNGSAQLKVNSFIRTRGGDIKLCAGYEVVLWKVTRYSSERLRYLYDSYGDIYVESAGNRYLEFSSEAPYMISKTCDSQGNVVFDGVPIGQYYVASLVMWDVVNGSAGLVGQGGRTAKTVMIDEATTKLDIVLSR